jgi:hypothetical protein
VPLLKVVATTTRKRKRSAATTSAPLPQLLLQWLVGVVAHKTKKCPHQASNSDDDGAWCKVHNSACHNIGGCWEIKKLTEWFCENSTNCNKMVLLPASRRANKKVDPEEDKAKHIEFQNAKRVLKVIYGHSDSDSSSDES